MNDFVENLDVFFSISLTKYPHLCFARSEQTVSASLFKSQLILLKNVPNHKIGLDNIISIDNNNFPRKLIFPKNLFIKDNYLTKVKLA
jgi:hypothetical protein